MDSLTFLQPGWLALLALAGGLIAGYVRAQRRKSLYAIRFTNTDLLKSVMPRRPGWRRHLPPALMLMAIVAMTFGLADPAVRIRGPRRKGRSSSPWTSRLR